MTISISNRFSNAKWKHPNWSNVFELLVSLHSEKAVIIFQVLLSTEKRGPLRSFPPRSVTKANPLDPILILQQDLSNITT
jgi:hypothetical protein